MTFQNRDRKDFNAGIMYICIGISFAHYAQNYPMGTTVQMGPGYFPTAVSWLLTGLGVIVLIRSFFRRSTEAPAKTHWRPLIANLGAAIAFGILVDSAGLVIACAVMMFFSALGGWDFRWKEQLINTAIMTSICIGIFYYGLKLPFKLFPWS